jgi:hypothetical protein
MGSAAYFHVSRPTNSFVVSPSVTHADKSTVIVNYQASAGSGKAWVNIVVNTNRPLLDVETIKLLTYAEGAATCQLTDAFIAGNSITQHHLTNCQLLGGQTYYVFVYAEDQGVEWKKGSMSEAIPIHIAPSNNFVTAPQLTATPIANANGGSSVLSVEFTATESTGKVFLALYASDFEMPNAQATVVSKVRTGSDAICSSTNDIVLTSNSTHQSNTTVSGCALTQNTNYNLYVYVEDALNQADGTL